MWGKRPDLSPPVISEIPHSTRRPGPGPRCTHRSHSPQRLRSPHHVQSPLAGGMPGPGWSPLDRSCSPPADVAGSARADATPAVEHELAQTREHRPLLPQGLGQKAHGGPQAFSSLPGLHPCPQRDIFTRARHSALGPLRGWAIRASPEFCVPTVLLGRSDGCLPLPAQPRLQPAKHHGRAWLGSSASGHAPWCGPPGRTHLSGPGGPLPLGWLNSTPTSKAG